MSKDQSVTSNQICVSKNSTKLIEFTDKLKAAPVGYYAHIHARADQDDDGERMYSVIGVFLKDYTDGTGDSSVNAWCNLDPEIIRFIFLQCQKGVAEFSFSQSKIFGKEEKGRKKMTHFSVQRREKTKDGEVLRLPWTVQIKVGTAIPKTNRSGGTYAEKDSFKCESDVFIKLADVEFYSLFSQVVRYIDVWEIVYGRAGIVAGRKKREEELNEKYGDKAA